MLLFLIKNRANCLTCQEGRNAAGGTVDGSGGRISSLEPAYKIHLPEWFPPN